MSMTKYGVAPEGLDKTAQQDEPPKACPKCKTSGPHACVTEHSPAEKPVEKNP